MRGSCWDLLSKRTNKYEKTAAEFQEFAEFKEDFKHCKVRSEGLTYLRDHYFKQQKEDPLIITKKNSDPNHYYIDEKKSAW